VVVVHLINVTDCFVGNLFAAHQKDVSVFLWQYLTAVSVIIDFPYPPQDRQSWPIILSGFAHVI
jgi:hypothetical protein